MRDKDIIIDEIEYTYNTLINNIVDKTIDFKKQIRLTERIFTLYWVLGHSETKAQLLFENKLKRLLEQAKEVQAKKKFT